MSNHHDVISRWLMSVTSDKPVRSLKCHNVFYEGESVYSYGRHFPLARAIRRPEGMFFLVNGDTVSNTTSRHQSVLRSVLTGQPQVIIPFSVLDAAGIDRNSVRLIEALPDRTVTTRHASTTMPDGAQWRDVPVSHYVPLPDEVIEAKLDAKHAEQLGEHERFVGYARREQERIAAEPQPTVRGLWADYLTAQPPARPTRESLSEWDLKAWRTVRHDRRLFTSSHKYAPEITVVHSPEGTTYEWETSRHWLGESLIEAEVSWLRSYRCATCKGTGEAAEAPPQPTFHGMWVRRWDYSDGEEGLAEYLAAKAEYDARLDEFVVEERAWSGTWRNSCPKCKGRARWTKTFRRRSQYLSGFDRNERRPSYFFCELPKGSAATTVEEAIEALKPETVRVAEQMGREVRRQGDIFAVPMPGMTRAQLRKAGARFVKRGNLLGTNHAATEVAELPNGTQIVRGCLYHVPDFRDPDHARVRLGADFHVVVKNTVPLAA